jgi:hypothetical protein
MNFTVYHTKSWALNSLLHCGIGGFRPHRADYKTVATVECDSLGEVFQLTNHIDHSWTENEGVFALMERVRSTSVGDVVMENESGNLFVCAGCGWEQVGDTWNHRSKNRDIWWAKNGKRYSDLVEAGL